MKKAGNRKDCDILTEKKKKETDYDLKIDGRPVTQACYKRDYTSLCDIDEKSPYYDGCRAK